jgi:hypothetical protein
MISTHGTCSPTDKQLEQITTLAQRTANQLVHLRAESLRLKSEVSRRLSMIRKECAAAFPRDKRGTRLRGDHAQTTSQSAPVIHPEFIALWRCALGGLKSAQVKARLSLRQ